MQKWNSNVPELEADKQKEKKRREYFLQTFRLYSYSYLPRLFSTEYFLTIPKVPTTIPRNLNFEQNQIRQLFREYFK